MNELLGLFLVQMNQIIIPASSENVTFGLVRKLSRLNDRKSVNINQY
jgi:hypothetical protein